MKNHPMNEMAVDCIYTALTQLMQTKPYEEITISEITRRAGVSRMAYYRNYKEKDDIILKRFQKQILFIESNISDKETITEDKFLISLIDEMIGNPVFEYVFQAQLLGKAIPMLKDFVVRVYTSLFGFDLNNPDFLVFLYEKLGLTIGYILYLYGEKESLDKNTMAAHMKKLVL